MLNFFVWHAYFGAHKLTKYDRVTYRWCSCPTTGVNADLCSAAGNAPFDESCVPDVVGPPRGRVPPADELAFGDCGGVVSCPASTALSCPPIEPWLTSTKVIVNKTHHPNFEQIWAYQMNIWKRQVPIKYINVNYLKTSKRYFLSSPRE